MVALVRVLRQPFTPRRCDLADLIPAFARTDQAPPRHAWHGTAQHSSATGLGGSAAPSPPACAAELSQPLRCCAQTRLDAADAQARQGGLDPVAQARARAHQACALATGPVGILLRKAGLGIAALRQWSRAPRRAANRETPAAPAPRRDARSSPGDARARRQCCAARMDDRRRDAARAQPPRQPEPS
jgi:hypothetical protein